MKKVYTIVLKAFLNTLNYPITKTTTFFDLDKKARDIISKSKIKDFNFNHGTGHGIGINVHEMPPVLSPSKLAKKKLHDQIVKENKARKIASDKARMGITKRSSKETLAKMERKSKR